MMVTTKLFYLTYNGKGTYNVEGYSFIPGKTLEVDEKTYKRLVSPLFIGRVEKVKTNKVFEDDAKEETKDTKDEAKGKGKNKDSKKG